MENKDQQVTTFKFNPTDQNIRVQVINDEPWFVAKDVCDALGLENNRQATSKLDDDETMVSLIMTPSRGKQKIQVVNESGLYNLIFQSRKPEAKAFRKWVTSEVLPSIRRTGGYGIARQPGDMQDLLRARLNQLIPMMGGTTRCIDNLTGCTSRVKITSFLQGNPLPQADYYKLSGRVTYLLKLYGNPALIGHYLTPLLGFYPIDSINAIIYEHRPYIHNAGIVTMLNRIYHQLAELNQCLAHCELPDPVNALDASPLL